jgi:hypothetical protein
MATAVARLVDAALGVRAVRVAERCHVDDVGVVRIDVDAADLLRVAQPHEAPGLPAVGRAVDTLALGDVRAHVGLAGADVEGLGIGGRDRERADRAHRHVVEVRPPGAAGVQGLPHATVDGAEVEVVGLTGNARDREHAPATERPDQPPAQVLEQRRVHRGGEHGCCQHEQRSGKANPAHRGLRGEG